MSERDEILKAAIKFQLDNPVRMDKPTSWNQDMADFALEQIQAERKRIAADLLKLHRGHNPELYTYIAKLEITIDEMIGLVPDITEGQSLAEYMKT